jgi:putative transcriptional regulator
MPGLCHPRLPSRDKSIAAAEIRAKMMDMPLKIPSLLDEARLTGQLLIAMPTMEDPRFTQSVIYLCAHTEDGAMGLVLNRPLISPTFEDLLRQLDVSPTPPARRIALCDGGPSDGARGFVLHTADWLKAIASGTGPREGLLALGYASWAAGQLDEEIFANAWLSAPASLDLVFDADHSTKWRRAFASLRVDPALLSGVAGHA